MDQRMNAQSTESIFTSIEEMFALHKYREFFFVFHFPVITCLKKSLKISNSGDCVFFNWEVEKKLSILL